jgi:hypothetical protein
VDVGALRVTRTESVAGLGPHPLNDTPSAVIVLYAEANVEVKPAIAAQLVVTWVVVYGTSEESAELTA